MPILIEMPKLSDTMTEGTLVKWLKNEGDSVKVGDELAEIETDKATMAMVAFDDGVLHKILVQEGGKVPIRAHLGVMLEDGEAAPSASELASFEGGSSSNAAAIEQASAASPEVAAGDGTKSGAPAAAAVVDSNERVKASPLARKIAASKGLSLANVRGTGPGGRIVKVDVETLVASGRSPSVSVAASSSAGRAAPAPIKATASEGDKRIPLTGMRSIIAERLLASKTQIPHFYLNIEVDAGPLMALRAQVNAASERVGGNKYTVNDFVLKAIVGAISEEPRVNASFDGDSIIQFASVQLCVAIAVDAGLVTPVIRNAETKSLQQISDAVKDLATRARNKKLAPEEFQGGTITVSNLGSYGIDSFDAIINPPQAAILSIGAVKAKPVVNQAGEIVVGQRMWIGLSGDHRVVDGAVGATYLNALQRLIENPAMMLV
ncbi:MAG: pyruvate dehydrogenase complex dihydrolipoamide acetyltransferase [Verrucomicrobia bacterium]|nr:pyruvate dehydrogenase complex dihydrolipoamide acetyltransferase [Verrucomicrobiota bacterium]